MIDLEGLTMETDARSSASARRRHLTESGLVLLILALAAYLRLVRLDVGWFGEDQSALVSIALDFVNLGKIPLAANKSSAGVFIPPLIEYLYAIPLSLTREIVSVARFTALVNVAGVGVCYLLTRRFFGVGVGLAATLLYAVGPWAVHFSRMIWNPTPIPFFAALTLYGLADYFAEDAPGRRRGAGLVGAALALAGIIQLHLAALVLVAVVGLCGIVFHRRLRPAPVVLGIALFAATFVPIYLFERAAGFMDIKALSAVGRQAAVFNLSPLLLAGDLVSARGLVAPSALDRLTRWTLWASLLWMTVRSLRDLPRAWRGTLPPADTVRFILTAWVVLPLLAYLRQTHYLQHHYFLYLYPALYILIAVSAGEMWTAAGRLGRFRRWLPRALLLGALLAVSWGHLRVGLGEPTRDEQSHCPQIRHISRAEERLRGLLATFDSDDVVILSDGENGDESPLGVLRHLLTPDTRFRFVRLGNGLSIPTGPAVYLMAGEDGRTAEALSGFGGTEAGTLSTPCATWRFFVLPSPPVDDGAEAIGGWENGLRLVEYQLDGEPVPGGHLDLTTRWRVERTIHHEQYHFFNHLLTDDGTLVAQYDGSGVNSLDWFAGDGLVMWFSIPLPPDLPPGEYDLRVGAYLWPTLERVPLSDGGDSLLLSSVLIRPQ